MKWAERSIWVLAMGFLSLAQGYRHHQSVIAIRDKIDSVNARTTEVDTKAKELLGRYDAINEQRFELMKLNASLAKRADDVARQADDVVQENKILRAKIVQLLPCMQGPWNKED